jgi:amino acid transporter
VTPDGRTDLAGKRRRLFGDVEAELGRGRVIDKVSGVVKAVLVGRPKETSRLEHERLSKKVGLAVFASDNLSSSAYATEEMLHILVAAGAAGIAYSIPVAGALVGVVALIAYSYRATIHAYPNGGGAYIVAHDNLGKLPGLVAAASLLIDYVLTVSVSVAAGLAAIVSFAPGLHGYRVHVSVIIIVFITLMNLRGVRESGVLFAIPTYAFLVLVGGTIVYGLVRVIFFDLGPVHAELPTGTEPVTVFFLLRAFSRGSAAVTGIEAISNGIPAFREPSAKNASTTLVIMASLLAGLFMGITLLSRALNIAEPDPKRTIVGQVAHAVWGGGPLFVAVLGATALILFLAANTSYADFPRLSSVLARDRFWPRQFMNRGDRLAFSNGIIGLGVFASLLIVVFNAEVERLLNLYVMGVFTALTLSQAGMVVHWFRLRADEPRWRRNAIVNGIGGTATLIVLVIVLTARFTHGGWMVVVAVPLLVYAMNKIHRHYMDVRVQLRDPARRPAPATENHVVLLVGSPSQEERRAFWYAERIRTRDFHAVHFIERGDPKGGFEARWVREIGLLPTTPALETLPMEGALGGSVRRYVGRLRNTLPAEDFVTVIVSERVSGRLMTLGTPTGLRLKFALLFTPEVVVTNVPHIEGSERTDALESGDAARHVALVTVPAAHNATLRAFEYAKTLDADEIHALHVVLDPEMTRHHQEEWAALGTGQRLELIDSPYRDLGESLREHVRSLTADGRTLVTVVLPEFVVRKWWHHFLHNQNAFDVKWKLLPESDVVVTSVPYHLS